MFDFENDDFEDEDDENEELDETSESVVKATRQVDTVEALEATFIAVAQSLDRQLWAIPQLGEPTPLNMITDLAALLDAHERLDVLEKAFHNEDDTDDGRESAQFEGLRAEIGGKLDRLRAALLADPILDDTETPSP